MTSAHFNPMALAVPVFLLATGLEWWLGRRSRMRDGFAFGTTIADLACGSVFLAAEVVLKLATLAAYAWLFEHARLIDFAAGSPWPWVIGLVGVDVLFYWWHRVSHVVNVMWAVHGVHHQSEDYNLAVALRQPALEPITWFFFYAPLALLGVDPVVYLASYGVNRAYQFFIHTELVGKLGPLGRVFNTPSHHRVHHGVQDRYLDRNYGAILIVWDRLFGSFEPEGERPYYGTTVPLRSYNPVWANVALLDRIVQLSRRAKTRRERWFAWVAHPAWLPEGVTLAEPKPDRAHYSKYRPDVPTPLARYVLTQFLATGTLLALLVAFEHTFSLTQLVCASVLLIAGFTTVTGLIERRRWAEPLERARVLISPLVGAWLAGEFTSGLANNVVEAALLLAGVSSAFIWLPRALRGRASP